MKGIVDRFEGDYVVIEIGGQTQDIHRNLVDEHVEISDVVVLKNGKWYTDEDETPKRTQQMKALMDSVWED
ncbi:MAG: DUF3006 domain-containing protein [Bacillus sp. (in: firmicutes)]